MAGSSLLCSLASLLFLAESFGIAGLASSLITSDTVAVDNRTCPIPTRRSGVTHSSTNRGTDYHHNGGWEIPHSLPNLIGPCTIKKINSSLSQKEFLDRFAYTEPVIVVGVTDQTLFRSKSTRDQLLLKYGHDLITVTTANANSYPKVMMTLQDYVEREMNPQTLFRRGNDTRYHFGDNDREAWKDLFSLYQLPPYQLPGLEPVLSFGLAGPGTGVPFHVHGPTFAETIYGRKRWFFYPPEWRPQFDPDMSSLQWLLLTYPSLPLDTRPPSECVLHPGELLYFPDHWWHMTVNIDAAVFMSTFLA